LKINSSDEIKSLAIRYALANAVKHNGKADEKAVISKVMGEHPHLRPKAREIVGIVKEVVRSVNLLTLEEQIKKLESIAPELLEEKKKEEKKELPPLPNVEKWGKVVMRMAPFPSGPLHIGNARMAILNDEYVKRYNGELLLVYDDTIGAKEHKIIPEAYDLIKEGLEWLGVKWHKTIYKSDRLEIFYKYCKQLLEQGHAYVCLCNAEEWRTKYKILGKPCPHRSQTIEENLEHWERMLSGEYAQGEAVVRLKTGMDHPDPAMRDHVIMRISEREHPRVGTRYRVWPLLEFSWGIDDYLLGVTHILRGKDLIKEDMMEEFIWRLFNWPKREFIHYGKILFKGITLSKRKARKLIENGIFRGWDDPRTWSLQSLAKRGIRPEALRQAILNLGLSIVDIEYSPSNLYAYNRRLIDPVALRYFFVDNPIKLRIINIPEQNVVAKSPLHPEKPELGFRNIPLTVKNEIVDLFVSSRDLDLLKSKKIIRLKDLFNFEVISIKKDIIEGKFLSWSVKEARKIRAPIIHWVPSQNYVNIRVIMPDGNETTGLGEPNCKDLKVDQIVQFERFGFVRIDEITKEEILCYYTHD